MEKGITKRRYNFIDAMRGFALLHMIGYHFSYDVFILYGKYPGWLSNPWGYVWQQCICMSFILISGFSAHFSRSHLKRGLLLNGCGLLITVVTKIATPSAVVYFGILNLLGCALLLLIPVKRWITKNNWVFVVIGSFLLFLFTRHIASGYLGFGTVEMWAVPEFLYDLKVLTPFGFPYPGFYSSDYFAILPWFFLFLTGYASYYVLAYSEKLCQFLTRKVPVLSWLGRKSLIIYMLHQPVLMVVCMLLF